ncbi:MAG: hypothetical protein ACOYJQ_05715 [Pseudochelatococcus sp.]|jgi:hypothetical protein|uniref:hypothetical protein n=1 Tax=Pseudochelatococcus sp. TaxID=2020869 RepID=UPI003D8B23AF
MSFLPPKKAATAPEAAVGRPEGDATPDDDRVSRAETAAYVCQMSGELAALARCHRLDSVAYLLEMARREASSLASVND